MGIKPDPRIVAEVRDERVATDFDGTTIGQRTTDGHRRLVRDR
jgi:hypothetical protein